jgi:hypothetical protein
MAKKSLLGRFVKAVSKVEKRSKKVTKALKRSGKDFGKIKESAIG